jgi:hypothetical protein
VAVFCGAEFIFKMAPIFIDEEYFNIIFYTVSTVKHFRLQQQSVRDNENVVLQIEYWWKHIL